MEWMCTKPQINHLGVGTHLQLPMEHRGWSIVDGLRTGFPTNVRAHLNVQICKFRLVNGGFHQYSLFMVTLVELIEFCRTASAFSSDADVGADSAQKQLMMVVPSTSSHDGRGLTPSGPGASASG